MTALASLSQIFAPSGVLRAAINLGNPILAKRDAESGAVSGVSVDLAGELAQRLGIGIALVVVDTAAASVEAVREQRADVGFFAIDPARGEGMAFTEPYVLIEGAYLVPDASPLVDNESVDQAGHRVVVGKGSAYDLFLTRSLKHAEIVRAASSQAVLSHFVAERLEVAAGVKQQLQADMLQFPGHRLLPGRFMVIQQAMGVAKDRGQESHQALEAFVRDVKTSGFVAAALKRHGIEGASVAP